MSRSGTLQLKDQVTSNPNVTPFQFQVPDAVLNDILVRVAGYPWHEMPDDGGWDYEIGRAHV